MILKLWLMVCQKKHPLKKEFESEYFFKESKKDTYESMMGLLESLNELLDENDMVNLNYYKREEFKKYDVFLSHANKDKVSYVEDLYKSLKKLGVNIFYDTETLEWGDNWKDKILEGIKQSEFAILVISDNYFGREWTERELFELLNKQSEDGQKIVLPLLYNITIDDLKNHYPLVGDIQALCNINYNTDQIAIQLAKQLIKRLKKVCGATDGL